MLTKLYRDDRKVIPQDMENLVYKHLEGVGESEQDLLEQGYVLVEENHEDFAITSKPDAESYLDTELYKIRYKYLGPRDDKNRTFCANVLDLNLIFRKEDINMMSFRTENRQFGTYSIFDYKGSYGCRHRWNRQVYKKEKRTISPSDIGKGYIKIPSNKIPKSYVPADSKATTKNENLSENNFNKINFDMIKVYEFVVDPNDEELGMTAISIVDRPAIESEFISFKEQKEKRRNIIQLMDEKKKIVSGLALIPNKMIYRIDENNEEYLGYFSDTTIENIMNKFMNSAEMGVTKKINLNHNSEDTVKAHLIESFILRTPEMVDAVVKMGIEDAKLGSWFVSYQFDTSEDFKKVIESNFTGFSIEIFLTRELRLRSVNKLAKLNDTNKNNIMDKITELINKFKNVLSEFDAEPEISTEVNTFEDVKVKDSEMVLRYGDVGTPVLSVIVAEDGTETTEPVTAGDYILDNGMMLVVDDMGNLLEVKEEAIVEPINPEDLGNTVVEEKQEDVPVAGIESKPLSEIVNVTVDGEYYIKVTVAGGAITAASVESEQILVSEADFNNLQKENLELKEKIEKPITKSILEFTEPRVEKKSKADLKKMSNLELTLHKLGLE